MLDGLGTAHALVGLAAAFLALRRGTDSVGVGRLVLASSVVAAVVAAQLVFLVPRVRTGWGVVDLLRHDLLIVPPAVGLWRVTRPRGRATPAARALGVLGVLLLPVLAYANLVAPYDLRLEEVDVPLPRAFVPADGGRGR